ncbi:MAG: TRAP transporter small permease subunit, partial [Longicatena sp.]
MLNKLFKWVDYFTGILTGLMVFFVFLNVVLRMIFNSGLTWSEEISRYLFVYVTYIGAISAMHSNGHLGVDTLSSRVKPRFQLA